MKKLKNLFWLFVVFGCFCGFIVIIGAIVKFIWMLFRVGFYLW